MDEVLDLSSSSSPKEESPMDLSVKRPSVIRPNSLSIERAPSVPVKEQPRDILSPLTDSSVLLKSIYDTTSSLTKKVSPPRDDDVMLHTYLKERAVIDSARKRKQYLLSPSAIDGDHGSFKYSLTVADSSGGQQQHQQQQLLRRSPSLPARNPDLIKKKLVPDDDNKEEQPPTKKIMLGSTVVTIGSSSTSYIVADIKASGRNALASSPALPSTPANLTVVNSSEKHAKPSFIAPSGVIPSPSTR